MTDSSSSAVDKLDTDENNSNESESSPSPPSYAVFEDEHGNLVNPALNVIWPMRPRRGRYSLKEYREQKQRFQKHSEQQRQNKRVESSQKDSLKCHIAMQQNKRKTVVVVVSMWAFNRHPMPIKMPLMLAYMSSSGKIYNFGFKRHEFGSESFWQLDLSGIEDREQPLFRSMSALIQYYKSLVIDRGDGKTEIFPVD